MRALLAVLVAVLMVAGCGEDETTTSQAERDSTTTTTAKEKPPLKEEKPAKDAAEQSDDPLKQAEAYAREQYPEATATDDFLAAAVSGCYLGITDEYLGGPAGWSPERVAKLEYPEPELRAILDKAREDCG